MTVDQGASGVVFASCLFRRGQASLGGALFVGDSACTRQKPTYVRLIACLLADNTAGQYGPYSRMAGGAIFGKCGARITLINCTLSRNRVEAPSKPSQVGGAIAVDERSALIATSCRFERNHAPLGGAISAELSSSVVISEASFINNTAQNGAALYLKRSVSALITSSHFQANVADCCGAVSAAGNSSIQMVRSSLVNSSSPALQVADCDVDPPPEPG